jgi:hypothetical protein
MWADPVSSPLGDLDSPIHPLFSHDNFRELVDTIEDGKEATKLQRVLPLLMKH